MKRIPIKAARDVATKYKCTRAILFMGDDKLDHIVTWGKTLDDCERAATFGNALKGFLGWPKCLHAEPSRVKKLVEDNTRLRKRLALCK